MQNVKFKMQNFNKVLILVPNWVGDAILSIPAMAAVRKRFNDASITILARSLISELFKYEPYINEIVVNDFQGIHKGITGKWKLINTLKAKGFGLAILFPNSLSSGLISYLSNIPYRCGYPTDGRGLLININAKAPDKGHMIDYYAGILLPLGIDNVDKRIHLDITEEEKDRAIKMLKGKDLDTDRPIIGINPGATYGTAKRWYPERFAALSDRIARHYKANIVLFGGKDERAVGEKIAGMMKERATVLSGETTIREAAALIENCDLFITNDSGLMHVAAAVGVPVVAIFGPTDPESTSPYGEGHTIVRKEVECSPCLKRECPTDHRCMKEIEVEDVYEVVERQMKEI